MIETTVIIQIILTVSLSVIGFFLRGIYNSVQEMSKSIQQLNERLIRHETNNETTLKRIQRLEEKIDHYDEAIRDFYAKYDLTKLIK